MTTKASQAVSTKIFIGFALNPELRIQLNQSHAWKQSRITAGQDPTEPIEIRFNNKDYLGFHVDGAVCPWPLLQNKQKLLKEALGRYCPNLNPDSHKIYLFSQLFIA